MSISRVFAYTGLLNLCLLISACSTLSQEECMVAQWQIIGHEDGVEGRDPSYISNHRKACAEYGIAPDLEEYRTGYQKGLLLYCVEYNGFNQGKNGADYRGVCPTHLEQDFLHGYNQGYAIYELNSRISQAQSSITTNTNEMKNLDEEIKKLEDRLVADDTSSDSRRKLLEDLKARQIDRGSLENQNHTLEIEVARIEGELKGLSYEPK
jgi:hypothetical protein